MLEYELSKRENEELQEYLVSIKSYPVLAYTELNNLLQNPTSENQQKFIHGSLKMVANYATKLYQELKQYFVFPYSIIDFIQSGNETLIKLVYEKRYDDYHSFVWAFYIALRRTIVKDFLPISNNVVDKYLDFLAKQDEFLKKHQHEASDEEMIKEYGYGKKGIDYMNNYLRQNQVLKRPLNDEVITDGWDYIPELVYYLEIRNTILEILNSLNLKDSHYEIFIKYFGLTTKEHDGSNFIIPPLEISEEYNFNSRQRIHEIVNNTLDKIKRNEEVMKKLTLCRETFFK